MRTLLVVGLLLADAAFTAPGSAQPGRYRADVRITGEAKRWPEVSLWTATVRDTGGRQVYVLTKEVPYDVPYPSIAVSEVSPRSVVVSSCEGWVEFYDATGVLAGTWTAFSSRVPDHERIIKCATAGERIAFLLSQPGGSRTRVHLADWQGRVSHYRDLPLSTAGEIWLAADGRHLVAGCTSFGERLEEATFLIDLETGASREFPLQFRRADVSTEATRYVIAGLDRIIGGDLGAALPAWEWKSAEPARAVSAVRIIGTATVAAVDRVEILQGQPVYMNTLVVVLDREGEVIGRNELRGSSQEPSRLLAGKDGALVTLGVHSLRVSVSGRIPDAR